MEITLPDQIKLYFDKAGLGDPTFIFIHGGGADTSHLAPQFYFFARRGTAVNLDLRGYGKSDKPMKYGTIAQYADDVAYLCRQLKITSPIIIGHSTGNRAPGTLFEHLVTKTIAHEGESINLLCMHPRFSETIRNQLKHARNFS